MISETIPPIGGSVLYVITTIGSLSRPPSAPPSLSRFYRSDRDGAVRIANELGDYSYVQEYRGGAVIHESARKEQQ